MIIDFVSDEWIEYIEKHKMFFDESYEYNSKRTIDLKPFAVDFHMNYFTNTTYQSIFEKVCWMIFVSPEGQYFLIDLDRYNPKFLYGMVSEDTDILSIDKWIKLECSIRYVGSDKGHFRIEI